ncbi:MAG: nucleoside hydrolase [Anaerolineae bacterium]|nr:nucleoside hydrolase [Anaerolineae bacterium]
MTGHRAPRQKIILDVDTGTDDAIALLMAGHASALELVGVTVVQGNAPLPVTLSNTRKALAGGGLSHISIYAGIDRPLVRPPMPTGPGQSLAFDLPEPDLTPTSTHAVDFLVQHFLSPDGPHTVLVPVAPLTNLATALLREPRLAVRVPRLVMMGGAAGAGNATPSAEFNVYADPEAAQIVFRSGIPITMVGLEATASALIGFDDVARIRALGTPQARVAADLMDWDVRWFHQHLGRDAEIYDACAVAAVIEPGILTTRRMSVDVEIEDEITLGRTICTEEERPGPASRVDVALQVDRARFFEIMRECLG